MWVRNFRKKDLPGCFRACGVVLGAWACAIVRGAPFGGRVFSEEVRPSERGVCYHGRPAVGLHELCRPSLLENTKS